jgi:hypothetical protein
MRSWWIVTSVEVSPIGVKLTRTKVVLDHSGFPEATNYWEPLTKYFS